ncbi:DUF11 domain-containing protein [Erythrobacter litoralis]|uniref:DUF11 domain-containing protein n=1 Tax=Erythrobacter litoralis (strain HTCC2594) TaxID=314225 RepID=Q2NAG5_ERYLH|nr:DUF11 domain-containing protein [Erythrobacter litoralis]ABC63326.1 hypothetical protein ELI_06170 [Erythrobacter litoralis HTCC2594]
MAAALVWALLLFVAPAAAQTITNTARADWTEDSVARSTTSNTVTIERAVNPLTLETFRPLPSAGSSLPVRASTCNNSPLVIFPGSADGGVGIASAATAELRIGEVLVIRASAPLANRSPDAVDTLTTTITTPGGDREVLEIFETGPDTGIFTGAIRTRATPPSPTQQDCQLSVSSGEQITVALGGANGAPPLVTTLVGVLADPYGFVFDSEDGSPVSGATVTLVDAATGLPATVFADDGVTPWPSTVVSGEPIRDAADNVYPMQPGEFRFPLAPLGSYRLVVTPPGPYTAPSVVQPPQLAGLTRPDGSAFVISDASYGASFALVSIDPVRVDIPVDRPNVSVTIMKSASRARAQPGDAIFYTVTLRNPDPARTKRGVTLVDLPSPWLRLRADSVRVDGRDAASAVTIAPDGRRLAIDIASIEAGGTVKVTYAMVVRPDAPPGQAVNRAEASDPFGGRAVAEASVRIERDTIASRMTIIGRVTSGTCDVVRNRVGIPGVRVMLEDGSFALTDHEGRYHFEGVVPGTHVVQAQRQTLPEGGRFVDCDRSSRSAGNASSHFVTGQGGSLAVVDFTADVPGWIAPAPVETPSLPGEAAPADSGVAQAPTAEIATAREAAGNDRDWLAEGDGPNAFLFPEVDHNPRAPAVRVVIRHRPGQSVELSANGKPVSERALDAVQTSEGGFYSVSIWRGVSIDDGTTRLRAIIRNEDGSVADDLTRNVEFVATPWHAEIVRDRSHLIADGRTRPVIAVRLTDRRGRPVHDGVTGSVTVSAPYESAALLDQLQLRQLAGQGSATPTWTIAGDDGIALVELAPTMVSGPLHLSFSFADREATREQQIESWIVPGDLEWTVVGLAEGSIGAKTIADNMERTGNFDSDLGNKARVALYAKGHVLGKFIATIAYDSAKQEDDQRLLGTIDPNAYYTVFADGSDRRFDAASREKLYVRIETSTFYALYGDFVTGFDQTLLGRYERTATGVKAEGRFGALHAQGFAAKIASRFRRDEIQGNGLSGPYRLGSRDIVSNSEIVAIETRDRLRSEIVVERRELIRFIDYDIDPLSGTISFKEPVLSRDFDLNPQFIVIDYEVFDGDGKANWNAGARADYTFGDDVLRVGVTGITDKGDGARTDLGAIDLRARIASGTEIRAEAGTSRREGANASAWLVEAEHRTGSLDILAYARSTDADYGTGQQTGAELGRRKFGVDARYSLEEHFSLVGSAWYDESLTDDSDRRAVQVAGTYRTGDTELRLGIARLDDRLADGTKAKSTVLEGAVSQRLLDDKLELSATTSVALDDAESLDLPARHRLRARYSVTDWLRVVGVYEIADGEIIDARTFNAGFELTPWQGSRIVTSLGQQDIAEQGKRTFAAFGLSQSFTVTSELSIDATLDGNRELGGADAFDVLNPLHPVASGGHLSQDGALFEDFTAATLGASWRKDRWSATARGEIRDGEFADRVGLTAGIIRQLDDGIVVGSGLTWTRATGDGGVETEIFDAALSTAYRPAESSFAFLGKLAYRSDSVTGAVAGEVGPAGRTALTVDGDAKSRRLVGSLSANWSPHGVDEIDGVEHLVRRSEIGIFLGGRYNFDRVGDFDLAGTTVLGGLDLRIGIGDRLEIGGTATVRTNLTDGFTSFAVGPQIGFVPTQDTLVIVGYNIAGFRDRDFSEARNTDKGLFASVRVKFDADTFSFLGLNR